MKPTDQEMDATEYRVSYTSQEQDAHQATGATCGSTRFGQEAEGAGEKHGQGPLLWFLWEETSKAREAGLGLASLNTFSGLCGVGAAPGPLVPGLWVMRAGGKGSRNRRQGVGSSGLVSLHMKGMPLGLLHLLSVGTG